MTVSIWPRFWSRRKISPPRIEPNMPPAIITPPIFTSTPRRRRWVRTPETDVPIICVVEEATATAGGMP